MLRTEFIEVPVYAKIIRFYSDNGKEILSPVKDGIVFYVYILKCVDKSFYVGFTNDVARRVISHNKKEGAEYTKKRLPIKLIYCEVFKEKSDALKRENQLKGWSRKKKVDLICKEMRQGSSVG